MKNRKNISIILNLIIFVFTLFATVSMIIGFEFMGDAKALSSRNFYAFKYFTVDSNVFAALVSLAYVIYRFTPSGKENEYLNRGFYILKLAATTGVTLTMLVTIFFLSPKMGSSFLMLFMNSNLFMHLITPILCIISFIFFEPVKRDDSKFLFSLSGIIPMLLYAIFYIPNILLHLEEGKPSHTYDWYGFLDGGINTAWFVFPAILVVTWLFALALWGANRGFSKKLEN